MNSLRVRSTGSSAFVIRAYIWLHAIMVSTQQIQLGIGVAGAG